MKKLQFKVQGFNPVDHMESDEEIIEYMLDCLDLDDDPDGIVFQRACEYVVDSKGLKVFSLIRQAMKDVKTQNQQKVNSSQPCVVAVA